MTVWGSLPMWSEDLENWNESQAPIGSVAFGQGLFVGATPDGEFLTSPDGASWTQAFRADEPISIHDLAYGDGLFVAVGETGDAGAPKQAVVLTSADGKAWTLKKLEGAERLWQVTYGNGLFVARGTDALAVSAGGTDWEISPKPTEQVLSGMAYGAGRFVGVGKAAEPVLVADVCGALFDDVPAGAP